MRRIPVLISILLTIGLVLAACQAVPTPVLPSPASPTSTPTPTPPPAISVVPATPVVPSYLNTTYGFSLSFPSDWVSRETGQHNPVVEIRAPGRFPFASVSLNYPPQTTTAKGYATEAVAELKSNLTGFTVSREGEIFLAGGSQAYWVEFTWTSDKIPAKGRFLMVPRGSQAFEVMVYGPAARMDSFQDAIERLLTSFRLEEPSPFGIPRQEALTLYDEGPLTLDPALSREARSHAYMMQLFSGLVAYDKDLKLVPEIAEKWQVSQDGETYTFYLRRGVKFHNGGEVKAGDFKFSWERAATPETGSQTAATYLGDILGVKEMLAGQAKELQGVKVVDDYTLQVTIDAPKAYFLAKLTYPVAFVVDSANVARGKEWWRQPNGTGPFKLKEWRPDELLVLERNAGYYNGPARLGYVVFRLFGGVPVRMYEAGEIDVSQVFLNDLERVQDEANPLHRELRVVNELSVFYIGFTSGQPPFDDVNVRRAFALAVDKGKILKRTLQGMMLRADSILPPELPGFNPKLKPLAFDPARARELLASSKYGQASQLPPITLTVGGEGSELSGGIEAIHQEWKTNLGVDVKIRQLEPQLFFYQLKKEKNEMFDSGWIADYPDPQNFLDVLFRTGSEQNTGDYSNTQVDALLRAAAVEPDTARRWQLYREAEQKLIDDAAILPLWFGRSYMLVKPYVKGYAVSPLGFPLLYNVSLEPH